MVRRVLFCATSFLLLALGSFIEFLPAANTSIGSVEFDTNTWSGDPAVYIGHTSDGSMMISDYFLTSAAYMGYAVGTVGSANVTGRDGTWENRYRLYIGYFGSGNLTIDSAGSLLSGEPLYVGYRGNGTLNVEDGSMLKGSADIGSIAGSTGQVTVTGTDSSWSDATYINVGYEGDGLLAIEAGARVISRYDSIGCNAGSTGTAIVTGVDSAWMSSRKFVGDYGKGTLLIEAGARVISSYDSIGRNVGSTGTAIVTGVDATWVSSSDWLEVGYYGKGALFVEAGAHMDSFGSYLGHYAGSSGLATVTGLGSRWRSAGRLNVGAGGNGELAIDSGGEVISSGAIIGSNESAVGTVIVKGNGSTWTSDDRITLSLEGKGILAIESGGYVESVETLIGAYPNSLGTATVTGTGSRWVNTKRLSVGYRGNGTLTIEAGGQVNNSYGFLGDIPDRQGAFSNPTGAAIVTGAGSQWANNSGLIVGNGGRGTLTIEDGGLVSVGGTLTIDYDSDGDSFLNLATGGMLALKGEADDSLSQFLDLVGGTGAIRYWDASLSDWKPLTSAIYGTDYTLEYLTEGDLTGYTLLTVGAAIPEPATWLLTLGVAMVGSLVRRK